MATRSFRTQDGSLSCVIDDGGDILLYSVVGGRWKHYPKDKAVDPSEMRLTKAINPDLHKTLEEAMEARSKAAQPEAPKPSGKKSS